MFHETIRVSKKLENHTFFFVFSRFFFSRGMDGEDGVVVAVVEGGGTTFRVALAKGKKILEKQSISTTTPEETLSACVQWLKGKKFEALGIASFGPLDLNKCSETYGFITATPKPNWNNCNLLAPFKEFNVPIRLDTDVNGAAIAHQFLHDATRPGNPPLPTCAYITVGTGVGVGIVINGTPVHGLLHPEAGHIIVGRKEGDTFEGTCPYHGHCLEGLIASGPLAKRKGIHPSQLASLSDDDELWEIAAYYLAKLCEVLTYSISPHFIVLGGGVLLRKVLFPLIRNLLAHNLNGFLPPEKLSEFVLESPFGADAGIHGAIALTDKVVNQISCKKKEGLS